ncbi:MAG: ASCH domain-containing protein [Planctomycetaceae bacterium]
MTDPNPDPDRIALGVRQPWAELILRGIKTIEVRSQDTNVRGQIYLYASKRVADIEPADVAIQEHGLELDSLPLGRIVGTVDIVDSQLCRKKDAAASCVPQPYLQDRYGWRLANPVRFADPWTVRFLPYGVWFYPFKRRTPSRRRS